MLKCFLAAVALFGAVAVAPASATMTWDVSEANLSPQATPQNFSLSVVANTTTDVEIYQFKLEIAFAPTINSGQVKFLGYEMLPDEPDDWSVNSTSSLAPNQFLTSNIIVDSFNGNGSTLEAGNSTLVRLDFELVGNPNQVKYNATLTQSEYLDASFDTQFPDVKVGGYIATPEPASAMALIALASAGLMQRRRLARRKA